MVPDRLGLAAAAHHTLPVTIGQAVRKLVGRRDPGPLSHNKICNIEDFSHPVLGEVIRRVFSFEASRFPGYPRGREYRKQWEVAMALRALEDLGAIRPDAEILGVGAGNEATIFYLTSFVKRVFATDLYLEPGVWKQSADASMMSDPGIHWPSEWNPQRLVVQHMDGLDLKYEDDTFDGIFSSSSLEHFGKPEDVVRAVDEIYRVLKPGGVFSVSTEFRLEGPSPGLEGCLMFDEKELIDLFVGDRGWSLASALDLHISAATLRSESSQKELADDIVRHIEERGRLVNHELEFSRWPQIVMRFDPYLFTSVHLALVKA